MLTLWNDFDRAFFGTPVRYREPWRPFERLVNELSRYGGESWPRMNLLDTGKELVFTAELPGVTEKDLEVTVHNDALTVRAERRVEVPEGLKAHRVERGNWTFQRSIALPVPVDSERTRASLKNGVLTVNMALAPELEPRRITVKTR